MTAPTTSPIDRERDVQPRRQLLVAIAERRARDVTAVELTDRHQVDHRDQQADPAGERHRVELDVDAVAGQPAPEHRVA